PVETAAEDAAMEDMPPEPTAASAPDADTEITTSEPVEADVTDATAEGAIPEPTVVAAANLAVAADVTVQAAENAVGITSPPPTSPNESNLPQWAEEPEIDTELLFALINEALMALRNHSDNLETLWCQVGYYLFPETAPDDAIFLPGIAPDDPNSFPETPLEELILDWPY
ncbi:MAG: hypothetical protein ACE5I3_04450, partial [Phycisphaerae bacterium]